jgi:hypothetical protein
MIVIAATIKSIFSICPRLPAKVSAVLLESGSAGRRGSCRGKFCGMELQLVARVSIHGLSRIRDTFVMFYDLFQENDSSLVYIMS